ncbi:hypothetical protein J2794_002408 [Paraburkholderia terricola]|nr:hypothetical protein [Paraburkholderia terricola]
MNVFRKRFPPRPPGCKSANHPASVFLIAISPSICRRVARGTHGPAGVMRPHHSCSESGRVWLRAWSCCTFSATRRKACAHAEKPVDRETEDAPTCAVRGQPIVNPRLLRKKTRHVVANRTLACHCHQAIGTVPVGSGANQLSQTVKFLAKNHKQAARRRCNSPSPIDRSAGGGSRRVDVFVVLRMLLADVDLTKNVREYVARR